jgi:hypothetical protein
MTYREAYEEGVKKLEEHGVPDADLDAFYLLEYASGGRLSRARYLSCREDNIEDALLEPYRELLALRQKRIPLQQITGSQEFCGLNFLVNRNVLIPRQDTETLVEEALRLLRPGMRVLDLCTGSGCIIISLKKLCPGIEAYACDLSAIFASSWLAVSATPTSFGPAATIALLHQSAAVSRFFSTPAPEICRDARPTMAHAARLPPRASWEKSSNALAKSCSQPLPSM